MILLPGLVLPEPAAPGRLEKAVVELVFEGLILNHGTTGPPPTDDLGQDGFPETSAGLGIRITFEQGQYLIGAGKGGLWGISRDFRHLPDMKIHHHGIIRRNTSPRQEPPGAPMRAEAQPRRPESGAEERTQTTKPQPQRADGDLLAHRQESCYQ